MNKIKKIFLLILIFGSIVSPLQAETTAESVNIHLSISTPDESIYDSDMDVSACNSDNGTSEELKATPYCAILQSGVQSDWNWDWIPGAFLNSLNGIAGYTSQDSAGNNVYHYWSWSLNSNDGTTGLNQYELQSGDQISITFIDPVEETVDSGGGSGSGSGSSNSSSGSSSSHKEIKKFDLTKALQFLVSRQKEDGSFGEELYTDWATLALMQNQDYQSNKIKLIKYYSSHKIKGQNLTDYERRTMALLSVGLNPYNLNGENYIQEILNKFDGQQFGDLNLVNDDIFALMILPKVGYTLEDSTTQKTIDFILSKQKENGSWEENFDLTAATVVSLSPFKDKLDLKEILEKAKNYLHKNRNKNGSWGNISSTAWVLESYKILGKEMNDKTSNYLAENQAEDGGIDENDPNSQLWQTAYIISALSPKTWPELFEDFPKEEIIITPLPKKNVQIFKKKNNQIITTENTGEQTPKLDNVEQNDGGWLPNFWKIILGVF